MLFPYAGAGSRSNVKRHMLLPGGNRSSDFFHQNHVETGSKWLKLCADVSTAESLSQDRAFQIKTATQICDKPVDPLFFHMFGGCTY